MSIKIPDNYQTVMPYLILKDANRFIEFTENVFGARLTMKAMNDDNTIMHAELMIGEVTIMFADANTVFQPQTSGLFVYVEKADNSFQKAIEAGASVVTELSDLPYGRSGGVKDPCGNTWWITSMI